MRPERRRGAGLPAQDDRVLPTLIPPVAVERVDRPVQESQMPLRATRPLLLAFVVLLPALALPGAADAAAGAAKVVAPVRPDDPPAFPLHGPVCVLGHVDLLCPHQCADGVDNDGDGRVDGSDLGCDGPTDDDETDPVDPCNWVVHSRHGRFQTEGSAWGTGVSIVAYYRTDPDCDGIFFDDSSCLAVGDWNIQSCEYTAWSADTVEVTAVFTCGGVGCAGATSPHSLTVGVHWTGSIPCYAYAPIAATGDLHCHDHS